MGKGKLGTTNIPLQEKSLTAVYTATSWKKIPVSQSQTEAFPTNTGGQEPITTSQKVEKASHLEL